MREYEKPVVSVNDDLVEGVFAASGADAGNITWTQVGNDTDYNGDGSNVQRKYSITIPAEIAAKNNIKVVFTMSGEVVNGWGGGGSTKVSGNQLTLTTYHTDNPFEMTFQGKKSALDIAGGVASEQ